MRFARILSVLTAFALLLGSFGMAGTMAAAHQMPMAAAGHGARHEPPAGDEAPAQQMGVDCAMACSAVPPLLLGWSEPLAIVAVPLLPAASGFDAGTRPESEPPPPRSA